MKNSLRLIILIVSTVSIIYTGCTNNKTTLSEQETGTYTDPRDGKIYQTVKIGEQWIMAENMAYRPESGNYWTYENDTGNIAKYGYLYDWAAAKELSTEGWHLPSKKEWKAFRKSMKHNNSFNAIYGGIYIFANDMFRDIDECAYFWSCTDSKEGPWYCTVDKISGTVSLFGFTDHRGGKSVRLFRD